MPDTYLHRKGDKPGVGDEISSLMYSIVLADIPDTDKHRARRYVAGRARDVADCRELLDALGLLER